MFSSRVDFRYAKVVVLRTQVRGGGYLVANEGSFSLSLDRDGRTSRTARWTVELAPNSQSVILLKSCFNTYLNASNLRRKLGGYKVLHTPSFQVDSSIEWEPIPEGSYSNQVKLKTHNDTFLRACYFRKQSVNHERVTNQDEILWDVEILEIRIPEELHRRASTFYERHASQELREKAEGFFKLMDTDKDDEVSIDEFLNFFNHCHSNMAMDRNIFDAFDRNEDGRLQFKEIITLHYYMFIRAEAVEIKQFEESIRARIQHVQHGAQNESGMEQNVAYLDLITAMLQAVATVSAFCGCYIM